MFTASEGSVSLSSVAACVIFANFSRLFCTARRRGIKAFCARSWASRVAVEPPVPWAPPPSLRCVTVVSGPISGLYFLRSVSAINVVYECCAYPGIRKYDKGAFGLHVGFGVE
jgi:hypothetical protein